MMHSQNFSLFSGGFWPVFAGFSSLLMLLLLLDVVLRAIALWKAARADKMAWFIALMVLNTVGFLPIIYLLFFADKPAKKATKRAKR